jgi:branched-chain amino acid transport system ATP-binding protein
VAALETTDLSVTYGGLRAVNAVSIRVEAGQAVGLIGPNGAGKTSFLDGITGIVPARGRVTLRGEEISGLPAAERAERGLRRTWQSGELFDDLTVGENLAVSINGRTEKGGLWSRLRADWSNPSDQRDRVLSTLSTFRLESKVDEMPGGLPLGTKKLVGVARALVAEPAALALDEPAAGLDRFESRDFGSHLRTVVDAGTAVLLIDHDMELVLNVCDYIYVLDFGTLIAEGVPDQIRSDPSVLTAYLGRVPGARSTSVDTAGGRA